MLLPPEPLLLAAHRDPDPTAALATADWLDEHDQSDQAKYVRICCQFHDLGRGEPAGYALLDEADRLLGQGRLDWARPPRGFISTLPPIEPLGSPRGFPEAIIAPSFTDLLHEAERLFDHWPARMIRLSTIAPDQIRTLLQSQWAGRICGLTMGLRPGANQTEQGLDVLTSIPDRVQLAYLDLTIPHGSDADLHRLAQWEGGHSLRHLSLKGVPAPLHGMAAFAERGEGSMLEKIELSGNRFPFVSTPGVPHLDRNAVARLGNPQAFPRLKNLTLNNLSLATDAFRSLTNGESRFPQLKEIHLNALRLTTEQYRDLGELCSQIRPRVFDLSWPGSLEDGNIDALLDAWSSAPGLRELWFGGCRLSPRAIRKLVSWNGLRDVTWLDLNQSSLDVPSIRALAESEYTQSLHRLDLSGITLKAAELDALANGFSRSTLRQLAFGPHPLADTRAVYPAWLKLFRSPATRGLHRLHLTQIPLGENGLRQFADRADLPELEQLTLADISDTPLGLDRLMRSDRFPRLWKLNINGSPHLKRDGGVPLPPGWFQIEVGMLIRPESMPMDSL
ncbi:hypothetical protein [Tuwongella immobilis]|uniref:Repeat-companion domain protein n=1 Tax=Tuwongella immobilis TaxID=692036 RepID=A0A6C2YK26_9BACT|nr:hypothetical protein [Tuwongella immobilis]VIP01453.1 unnamed protein product [Tuwongella immobilis]VTR98451.1 unnamed protein product [Tuwongella immobilis]